MQQEWEKKEYSLVQAREQAVIQLYQIRTMVEMDMKKKVSPEVILNNVMAKLISITPHGKDNLPS